MDPQVGSQAGSQREASNPSGPTLDLSSPSGWRARATGSIVVLVLAIFGSTAAAVAVLKSQLGEVSLQHQSILVQITEHVTTTETLRREELRVSRQNCISLAAIAKRDPVVCEVVLGK